MDGQTGTRVDVTAVRELANRFDASAQVLSQAVHAQLSRLAFDGSSAGRAHVLAGDALHAALNRLADGLSQWSRASAEIAVALRVGADRYTDAELRAAARIG